MACAVADVWAALTTASGAAAQGESLWATTDIPEVVSILSLPCLYLNGQPYPAVTPAAG